MQEQSFIALVAAGSALLGSMVGGLTTALATWIQQRAENRRALARLAAEIELGELNAVVATIGHGVDEVKLGNSDTGIVSRYRLLVALADHGPESPEVQKIIEATGTTKVRASKDKIG